MLKKQIFFFVFFFFLPFMSCQLMEYDSKDKLFPGVSRIYTDTKDGSSVYVRLSKKITNTESALLVDAFTVRSPGDIHVVTNVAFVDATTLRLFLSNAITSHRQVTLSYESKKQYLTSSGVFLPSFNSQTVENNLTGLLVWNKLGSSYEVNNSAVGGSVVMHGGPTFSVGKFGNSMLCANTANYATINLPNMMYRGAITFWVAPQFDSDGNGISEDVPTFIQKTPWTAYPADTALEVYYSNVPTHPDYQKVIFRIGGSVGGEQVYFRAVSESLSFSADQWMHIAAVWDINGIDGTADTMRLYIDGVKVGSTNGAFPLYERKVFDFGRNSFGSRSAHSKLDNLQIYDYAKTDFNLISEIVAINDADSLLLWNKLGSASEVTNSAIGVNLELYGSHTFSTGKFGGSMLCDNVANYATITLPNMMYRGTIAFWVAPQFDSNGNGISEVHPSFVEKTPWIDYPNDTGLGITYNNNPASGDYRSIIFQIRGPKDGGQEYATVVSGALSFSADQWMHVAAVWDIDGIDGTSDTMRLYIDGVRRGSTSGVFPLFERKTFDFGRNSFGNRSAHSKLDNLKIYNYAKTTFNLVDEY